jgi:uncharacterized protein YeeX (DUF496 family)
MGKQFNMMQKLAIHLGQSQGLNMLKYVTPEMSLEEIANIRHKLECDFYEPWRKKYAQKS